MNREGRLVQIALEFKAGLPDEILVLRIAFLRRILAEVGEQANGLEVDVEDRVGIGQQADSIGSRSLAQQNGRDDAADNHDQGDDNPKVVLADSHPDETRSYGKRRRCRQIPN